MVVVEVVMEVLDVVQSLEVMVLMEVQEVVLVIVVAKEQETHHQLLHLKEIMGDVQVQVTQDQEAVEQLP